MLPVSTKDRAVRCYLLVLRTGLRERLPVGTKDRAVRGYLLVLRTGL